MRNYILKNHSREKLLTIFIVERIKEKNYKK